MTDATAALAVDPEYAASRIVQGECHRLEGRHAEAVEAYSQVRDKPTEQQEPWKVANRTLGFLGR
jgi:hypothetical protein